MKCDIVIPIWNQPELTKSCVEHILKNTRYPYRLILVDNASDSQTAEYLENLKNKHAAEVTLISNAENLGFVKAINQGLKISDAPYVCILNNDTEPGPGWLKALVDFAESHPDAGLLNPICSGHKAENMTVDGYAEKISKNSGQFMEMNQCQGFCMLIKREVIDRIGYLDERFGMGGFDDTDYSMRAYVSGYKSVCVHSSYVYHREHATFNKMGDRKKLQASAEKEYFKKWPRHLRMAIAFSVTDKTTASDIENMLNAALFSAREWCWVNAWIFGEKKEAKARIQKIKEKIKFPLHQNIKFNYMDSSFKPLKIYGRLLERSFGTKRRKRYDAFISVGEKEASLAKVFCALQGCRAFRLASSEWSEGAPREIIKLCRMGKRANG